MKPKKVILESSNTVNIDDINNNTKIYIAQVQFEDYYLLFKLHINRLYEWSFVPLDAGTNDYATGFAGPGDLIERVIRAGAEVYEFNNFSEVVEWVKS